MRLRLLILISLFTIPASAQSLQFPESDGKHEKVDFEGWTLLAHLAASSGARYGLSIFFFSGKVSGFNASVAYVVVADESKKQSQNFRTIKPPIIGRASHTKGRLFEKYGKNILQRSPDGGAYEIQLVMKDLRANVRFTPKKAPVDMGQMNVGQQKDVRLYILPRGEISATLQYQNEPLDLNGFGIFQHEWGDSPEKDAASNMFALHFDDGTDVIIYQSPRFPSLNTAVISEKDGRIAVTPEFTAVADTSLAVPDGRDQFAMQWTIRLAAGSPTLRLEPTFDGQQIDLLGLPYWLGRCRIKEMNGPSPGGGIGYVYLRLQKS